MSYSTDPELPGAHSRDDGGRIQDVAGKTVEFWVMTIGSNGAERRLMVLRSVSGTGDRTVGGGAREPEACGKTNVIEDRGDAEEKEEPAATLGVEGRSAVNGLQVRGSLV